MPTNEPVSSLTPAMYEHLEQLNKRGIQFNSSELYIYAACQTPRTIEELAELRHVTYQAVQPTVKNLARLGILAEAFPVGRKIYWKSVVNLESTSDLKQKFTYREKHLDFEQIMWYLENARDITATVTAIEICLAHVYMRAYYRNRNLKQPAPSGPETKTFLLNIGRELEKFQQLIQQLLATEVLWSSETNLQAKLGEYDEKTTHLIDELASSFQEYWSNKTITINGFGRRPDLEEYIKEAKENWYDQRGSDTSSDHE